MYWPDLDLEPEPDYLDDWWAERDRRQQEYSAGENPLNAFYTRQLRAWHWISRMGKCAWEMTDMERLSDACFEDYERMLDGILNQPSPLLQMLEANVTKVSEPRDFIWKQT